MVFNSGWARREIEDLTYRELLSYVNEFYYMEAEKMFEFFKVYAINNVESVAVASHGKRSDLNKYAASVKRRKFQVVLDADNDHFENQFNED